MNRILVTKENINFLNRLVILNGQFLYEGGYCYLDEFYNLFYINWLETE